MEKEKINALLDRYKTGQCTEEEIAWLETMYNHIQKETSAELPEDFIKKDLYDIYQALPQPHKKKRTVLWPKVAAAVLLVSSIGLGGYFYFQKSAQENTTSETAAAVNKNEHTIGHKTYLTLANGTKVNLETASIGKIAEQEGITINKTKEGVIVYTKIANPNHQAVVEDRDSIAKNINMVSTSKGGQYQVILPDGTSVWLNALSTLKFPSTFSGKTREVELKGEGYFEVAKNKAVPFKVFTPLQEVEVLGTHFNINSYGDEPTTETTLLEGSVSVIQLKSKKSALLKPGQQSSVSEIGRIKIENIKAENVIAWKNGMFKFENSDISNVTRQFSRWYDLDFEFKGPIPDIKLWGEVHRNTDFVKALEVLSYFDLKYSIVKIGDRKKIIISK